MYYRVAIQMNQQPTWQWRSTALTSLEALFDFLRLYRVTPQDRLRVFSSASREDLNEQLVQENQGRLTNSVTAAQFLYERGMGSREMTPEVSARRARTRTGTLVAAGATPPSNESSILPQSPAERSSSILESRRLELERGAGGDHDSPYTFALPLSMPQTMAWLQLLVKVQQGALEQ
jgi:hypothetical protein